MLAVISAGVLNDVSIDNFKNEKLELGILECRNPKFYREVRWESGAVTQLY